MQLIQKLFLLIHSKKHEIVRFLKFCAVGVLGTLIDFGLFNLGHNVLGLDKVLANTISISAAIVNNYTWSRFWVYPETKDRQGGRKFVQFVAVSLMAWALNTGILWSTDHWLFGEAGVLAGIIAPFAHRVGTAHEVLSSNIAKVIATGIVLFWNFFANRLWTFSDVDRVPQATKHSAEQAS
jgi:putative flippase GtrA